MHIAPLRTLLARSLLNYISHASLRLATLMTVRYGKKVAGVVSGGDLIRAARRPQLLFDLA